MHKKSKSKEQSIHRSTIYDYLRKENENGASSQSKNQKADELLSCYAFILTDGFCYRANNSAIYAEANRQVLRELFKFHWQSSMSFLVDFK